MRTENYYFVLPVPFLQLRCSFEKAKEPRASVSLRKYLLEALFHFILRILEQIFQMYLQNQFYQIENHDRNAQDL